MAIEIERKFLVRGDEWRQGATGKIYRQGYLSVDPDRTVRVRIAGEEGFLTIKGRSEGMTRSEFEYPVPLADAVFLLERLCLRPLIEKTRYTLTCGSHLWEIDEFSGDNQGLILAEVELDAADEQVELPPWVGEEVTGDCRYYNASLIRNPFKAWQQPREQPMKCLTLLRHAKSSWNDPELNDFDRSLNSRGQRDAPLMARRLAIRGFRPDLVLASPALRARLTAEAVLEYLAPEPPSVTFDERIYLATADELLELVREIPEDRQNVLLVGHNPAMTELANFLVGGRLENLPTCGAFSVEVQAPTWRELDRGGAKLLFYDYPKSVPPEIPADEGEENMGCLKGKSKTKPKPGAYECDKCEAVAKKKGDLCKPKKIKEKDKKDK